MRKPHINPIASPWNVARGVPFTLTVTTSNAPEGDEAFEFRATGLPGGLLIDPETGVISGTPVVETLQTVTLTVACIDTLEVEPEILSDPVLIVIQVMPGPVGMEGAPPLTRYLDLELATGEVSSLAGAVKDSEGRACVLLVKQGDTHHLAVAAREYGVHQDYSGQGPSLMLGIKEFEDERLVEVTEGETTLLGSGPQARLLVPFRISREAWGAIFPDYETGDAEATVSALAELRLILTPPAAPVVMSEDLVGSAVPLQEQTYPVGTAAQAGETIDLELTLATAGAVPVQARLTVDDTPVGPTISIPALTGSVALTQPFAGGQVLGVRVVDDGAGQYAGPDLGIGYPLFDLGGVNAPVSRPLCLWEDVMMGDFDVLTSPTLLSAGGPTEAVSGEFIAWGDLEDMIAGAISNLGGTMTGLVRQYHPTNPKYVYVWAVVPDWSDVGTELQMQWSTVTMGGIAPQRVVLFESGIELYNGQVSNELYYDPMAFAGAGGWVLENPNGPPHEQAAIEVVGVGSPEIVDIGEPGVVSSDLTDALCTIVPGAEGHVRVDAVQVSPGRYRFVVVDNYVDLGIYPHFAGGIKMWGQSDTPNNQIFTRAAYYAHGQPPTPARGLDATLTVRYGARSSQRTSNTFRIAVARNMLNE